ncbi:tetraacyldisaccharide 4'-kinase [Vibrio sp. 10N.286.49.B3]|uniref:tetraacyldisaccharide 4'-kinase n=1 Tax=Vibrio sp. 10N.286.49.B3 TaxID=1880855 RepID=UPI000C85AFEE|nr:tetraacyldisaccharide 4'-kinase [Vibrio sp. 10N.286.49.B3]PMH45001.1 tetraacyldisaccharide 4'-kinase [Vibrio sp. 10N.286.49.B3]
MIEKIWFENHPLKYLLWPLLWPLSVIFLWISRLRRRRFLQLREKSYRAPLPVIIVGNITAGGNGKTPVVIWLVETLLAQGYRPGVVSRGYGGKAPSYPLILSSETPAAYSGDEPRLIYKRTGVPVAVAPKRADAVKALLDREVDVIVTDDGLQHYALDRDIEFSIIDGVRRFGNQHMIPAGPLREELTRQCDVDFIINNGGAAQESEILMTLQPSLAVNLVSGETKPVTELEGLVAFAGIGHPPRFFKTLQNLGAQLVHSQGFADHQDFTLAELESLASKGSNLIMTEKDAVKCDQFSQSNWWYLPVSAQFRAKDQQRILTKINKVMTHYGSSSN